MNMEFYNEVEWVHPDLMSTARARWQSLFNGSELKESSSRLEAREILLAISDDFLNDVNLASARDFLSGQISSKWKVDYKINWSDDAGNVELSAEKPCAISPIKTLASNKAFIEFPGSFGFIEPSMARTRHGTTQHLIETLPLPPKVIVEIDLSASDRAISQAINELRSIYRVSRKTNTVPESAQNTDFVKKVSSSGRPKNTQKIEIYYFDLFVLLQLGRTATSCMDFIKEAYPDTQGLILSTFEKQIASLRNFVAPSP